MAKPKLYVLNGAVKNNNALRLWQTIVLVLGSVIVVGGVFLFGYFLGHREAIREFEEIVHVDLRDAGKKLIDGLGKSLHR